MSTPIVGKCADCVEREKLVGPMLWQHVLFNTIACGIIILGFITLIFRNQNTYGFTIGGIGVLFFSFLLVTAAGIPWFRRNLIGEYLYLFRDGKKQYHCHKERPARWISVKVEEQDDWRIIPGHILRVRNGGYFRWNCELRFEDNDKILMPTTSGVWQIKSWNAATDLSLRDNSSGGIIPIAREDWKHSKRLLGERAVDILSNGPPDMLELLKRWTYVEWELNRVKAMHRDMEHELLRLNPELITAKFSRNYFAGLANGWLQYIKHGMGKSKYAQQIREKIEDDLRRLPDDAFVGLPWMKELRDELRAKDTKTSAAVTLP